MKLKLLLFLLAAALAYDVSAQSCKMDSKFSSSNINIPSTLTVAKTYRVEVDITNSGTCNWDLRHVTLSVKIVRGPSGAAVQRDELTPEKGMLLTIGTDAGKIAQFDYEVEGPYYVGSYTLEWQLLSDGRPFGAKVQKSISVVPPR